jgi:LysR family glycine cleavage system transcriptional activator
MDEWLVPVCSPALYLKYGPLREPQDLRRYPLLHSSSEPWTTWLFDGYASGEVSGIRGAIFDGSSAVVAMAAQGAGLALARWSLVADEISAGRLVRASSRAMRLEYSYWVVCPLRSRDQPMVRSFSSWLHAEAGAFPQPQT